MDKKRCLQTFSFYFQNYDHVMHLNQGDKAMSIMMFRFGIHLIDKI